MKTKLSRVLTLFLVLVAQVFFAQQNSITGIISDESGVLPGVSVTVKGGTSGTETNFDGKYTIKANSGDTLVFRYLGYKVVEKKIGSSNIISILLTVDANVLDEIVVTALGIKRNEKALGYATQTVTSEALTTVRDANIINSLSGKIAGVSITNTSGAVGASSRIVIRGISSISGDAQPLIVVDGVVMDNTAYGNSSNGGGNSTPNGLADLNQDDIESLNVLKGGAATSLYGMRGSNGVIVVTTKSGKASNKLGIAFSSSVSFENAYVLPDYQNSYGQGSNLNNFEFTDGVTGDGGVDESWGPPLDAGLEFVQWNSVNGEALPWVSRPNNIKDFFDTGTTTNHNISFSKGNEDYNGRISAGITDQKGILHNTGLTKYNLGGKFNLNLSDKWSVGMSASYIKTTSDNLPSVGYGDSNNQLGQIVWSGRQVDWNALRDYKNIPTAFASGTNVATPINWNLAYNNNPYWSLDTNTNSFDRNRLLGNVSINYQMTEKFSFSAQTGIDYFNSLDTKKRAFGTYTIPRGSYREDQRTRYEINSQAILSFNTDLGENFKVNANIGGNIMVNDLHRIRLIAPELQIPGLFNISNTRDGVTPNLFQQQKEQKINSVFGFAGISYKDYLFLDITGRNDWASVLPLQNNSFFYPSVTGSVILSDILDMPKNVVSYLKLRGGWSKTGSAGPLEPYSIEPSFAFSSQPWGTTPVAFYPGTLWNPDIKNEDTVEKEFGIETRLFQSRLRLDFTYYDKKTSDIIMLKDIDPSSGNTGYWDNAADITNKGVELTLGADIIRSEDGFNFGIDINFARNVNEAQNIDDDASTNNGRVVLGGLWNVDVIAQEGEAVGALFGPGFARSPSGDIIYENGIAQIDPTNKVLGNINADWTGGLGLNMSYKNLRLTTLFDVKKGGEIYSQTNSWGKLAGVLEETLQGRETGVIGEGVRADGNNGFVPNDIVVPAQTFYSSTYSQNIAESSVYDASFVKWRELSLYYTIPNSLIRDTDIDQVSFGVTARNLAILFRKVPHIDPESAFSSDTGQQGLEYAQIPSTRSIGFNLNVKF